MRRKRKYKNRSWIIGMLIGVVLTSLLLQPNPVISYPYPWEYKWPFQIRRDIRSLGDKMDLLESISIEVSITRFTQTMTYIDLDHMIKSHPDLIRYDQSSRMVPTDGGFSYFLEDNRFIIKSSGTYRLCETSQLSSSCQNWVFEDGEEKPQDRLLHLIDVKKLDPAGFIFDQKTKEYLAKPEYLLILYEVFPIYRNELSSSDQAVFSKLSLHIGLDVITILFEIEIESVRVISGEIIISEMG